MATYYTYTHSFQTYTTSGSYTEFSSVAAKSSSTKGTEKTLNFPSTAPSYTSKDYFYGGSRDGGSTYGQTGGSTTISCTRTTKATTNWYAYGYGYRTIGFYGNSYTILDTLEYWYGIIKEPKAAATIPTLTYYMNSGTAYEITSGKRSDTSAVVSSGTTINITDDLTLTASSYTELDGIGFRILPSGDWSDTVNSNYASITGTSSRGSETTSATLGNTPNHGTAGIVKNSLDLTLSANISFPYEFKYGYDFNHSDQRSDSPTFTISKYNTNMVGHCYIDIVSYTVTYSVNGHTNSYSVRYGSTHTIKDFSEYAPAGQKISYYKSGSQIYYIGSDYSFTQDTILTPVYEDLPKKKITITRVPESGGSASISPASSSGYYKGQQVTISANAGNYFTFSSGTDSNNIFGGSGQTHSSSVYTGEIKTLTTDSTLVVNFQAIQYKLTYNANEGSGAPPVEYMTFLNSTTISSTIPTRKGYTFVGGSVDKNPTASSTIYSPGQIYRNAGQAGASKLKDTTLYAIGLEQIRPVYIYDKVTSKGLLGKPYIYIDNQGVSCEAYIYLEDRGGCRMSSRN